MELLREAVERAGAGLALALVTVVRVWGSTPRHLGAKMLVTEAGESTASIGGGRVELEVTCAAVEVARSGTARCMRRHLARDLAMCCGGSMEFYIEPVAPSSAALGRALACWEARHPVLLITPLDGKTKIVEDMPAGMGRHPVREEARLLEPIWPRPRVILFGAGHVTRAIGPMAACLGFEVIVCDDNNTEALAELRGMPWLSHHIESFDIRDVQADIGALGPSDYALIMTREHAVDEKILEQLLPCESLGYLGLIGSRCKIGRFRKRLDARGVVTESRWARLHAPIGLDIGAETPAEIAVAVAAELVQIHRSGRSPVTQVTRRAGLPTARPSSSADRREVP